jgi:hypothetical protein
LAAGCFFPEDVVEARDFFLDDDDGDTGLVVSALRFLDPFGSFGCCTFGCFEGLRRGVALDDFSLVSVM